ncbi:MAG: Na+/H+ antiporter subunit A [Mycobacterium leprae]
MFALLTAHLVAALLAPLLTRAFGRTTFLLLAAVPAAGCAWLLSPLGTVVPGAEVTESRAWIPSLDLAITLRLDALSALLALLVTGVGALVLVYCSRYFDADAPGLDGFACQLVAFAGSMLGLVVADDMLLLYVFWELTTVFSYLLIGHHSAAKSSRRAAMQALIVTTAGGLAMLVGIVILGEQTGSYLLSDVVARMTTPATASAAGAANGTPVTVAVVLLLIGALSKSALIPFHFWLPAAMAAPTPVSAYLHAAAMVKAGVYLVARLAPAFASLPSWRLLTVGVGLLTMLLGGWRALRQHDLKLLLAFGTVSQLGFLVVLVGAGTRIAALAGAAMLLAHALFKAALFLVVGVIDHATGTRDLRRLSGLGRRLPWTTGAAVLAAASMAGLPPLAGFVAKEAAYEAYLTGDMLTLAGLVAGSMLTFAYSARFLWGAFGTKRAATGGVREPTPVHATSVLTVGPAALLSVAGLAVAVVPTTAEPLLEAYAVTLPGTAAYHLALWHGWTPALGLSVLTFAGGVLLFVRRDAVEAAQARLPSIVDADLLYRRTMRGLDRLAVLVTGATQRGSLPLYLASVLLVVVFVPGSWLLRDQPWPQSWRAWDTALQPLVAALVAVGALAATRLRQRVSAVLLVGVTGYGTGVLFVIHGAPDLALTQFLVETLTLVIFVLVLRKLPKRIVERHAPRERVLRLLLAVPAGVLVAAFGVVALAARTAEPISTAFPPLAFSFGGGKNVVNVTLVDIRAWDTIGEISVLVVAATGVASLVFLRRRTGAPPRLAEPVAAGGLDPPPAVSASAAPAPVPERWLCAGRAVRPRHRSLLLEVITRVIFHTIVVLSLYLLFAGHNVPGGGFAGGLVAGLAFVVRYLAAGPYELGEAAPVDPGLLLGLGLLLSGTTGVVGLLLGAHVLQTAILTATLPVFGEVKVVTSLFFDTGVYLVVVGLVLDVLRSLGAELDRRGGEA